MVKKHWHNDQDPWWEHSSSDLRGKDLKENLVHPLRRYLYRSACFVVIFIIFPVPQNFSWVKGRVGTWKVLAPKSKQVKTNYHVSFRCVHKDTKMWTCTDMQVDVHNITDWHASWRARHHRKVDMLKQVHIVNGKHIERLDVLYVLQK